VTEEQQRLVREWVLRQLGRIRSARQVLELSEIEDEIPGLFHAVRDAGTGDAESRERHAYQHVEDAIRYVKQFLADIGMHSQAKALAVTQNQYRALCVRRLGQKGRYRVKKLEYWLTGYLNSLRRVLFAALVVWTSVWVLLVLSSVVSGDPALIYASDQKPVAYAYYPYFSLVTLATLGYGDMLPNTRVPSGLFCAYLSAIEAALGVVLLGVLIYVLISTVGTHPVARPARWFEDYERRILRGDKNEDQLGHYHESFDYEGD